MGSRVRLVALGLAAVMLTSPLAASVASLGSFGQFTAQDGIDQDTSGLMLVNLGSATIKFHDEDGSNNFNCGSDNNCDPLFLSINDDSEVGTIDIRLSDSDSGSGGEQVEETSDEDFGDELDTLSTNFGFIDEFPDSGADGEFNLGENLYIDADTSGDVSVGDVQIIDGSDDETSAGSSTFESVTSTNDDENFGESLTTVSSFQYAAFDADANGQFGIDDSVVLDVNEDNRFNPGDVLLNDLEGGSTNAGEMPQVGEDLTFHGFFDETSDDGASDFAPQFAWLDESDTSAVGSSEDIFIDTDGDSTVSIGDVAVGPGDDSDFSDGEQIDSDSTQDTVGSSLETSFPTNGGELRFFDANGNDQYDAEDDLYLDVGGLASDEVESGDLVLACGEDTDDCSSPGQRVESGDEQIGNPLDDVDDSTSTLVFLDFNGGAVFNAQDPVYLDIDDDRAASSGDVPLSEPDEADTSSYGEPLDSDSTEYELCFGFDFSSGQTGWVDDSSPSRFDTGEVAYFDRAADGEVDILDLRLSGGTDATAGELVTSGDNDQGSTLQTFTSALPLKFRDANGDGQFSLAGSGSDDDHDEVFLDQDDNDEISINDVRLSESSQGDGSPGDQVDSSDNDLSRSLGTLPSGFTVRGVDLDGDRTFDVDDAIFLNLDEATENSLSVSHCTTPGDLQLSGSGGSSGGSGGGGSGGSGTSTTEDPPSVSISSPSDDQLVSPGSTVTIQGTADGGSDSISSITVTAGGQDLDAGSSSSWSVTWTTPNNPGDYTVTATVEDTEGETDSESRTLVVGQDADGDGVADHNDNCPNTPNQDQADSDNDGVGDACADRDGDGIPTPEDNCPAIANPDQGDIDGDGTGDLCDDDRDGDGVPNAEDAFPHDPAVSQDSDNDGVGDGTDNCPDTPNGNQADLDEDGTGDACDDDVDGDGLSNSAEEDLGTSPRNADSDEDGVADGEDNCPATENADQADSDDDGVGDACAEGAGGDDQRTPGPGVLVAMLAAGLAVAIRRKR